MYNHMLKSAALYIFFIGAPVYAADLHCPDISKTLREYSIDSSSSSYLNAVFSEHCQMDGSSKDKSGGVGLDAIVKAIPIKFTGSYSSVDQAFSNFCKSYQLHTSSSSEADSYKQTISAKALDTIQQCLRLQAKDIFVSHEIANAEAANFFLRGNIHQIFELTGVGIVGKKTTCTGQINGKTVAFDERVHIKNISNQSFVCTRTGHLDPRTQKVYYPESIITVMTSAGNYTLFWPKDERFSEEMASRIDEKITGLEGKLSALTKSVSPIVNGTELEVYRCPNGWEGESRNAAWMYLRCIGQLSFESTCTNHWLGNPVEVRQCTSLGKVAFIDR